MVYHIDFGKNTIYNDLSESVGNTLILGDLLAEEEVESIFANTTDLNIIRANILKCKGNFAKIFFEGERLIIMTSAFYQVFYMQRDGNLFISDNFYDISCKFKEDNEVDFDSCFYYISTGNYPPVERTFFKNIKKVPAENILEFGNGKCTKKRKYTYNIDYKLPKESYFKEYQRILNEEGEAWRKKIEKSGEQAIFCISGVDSFNALLAYGLEGTCSVHINCNKLQTLYVDEFNKRAGNKCKVGVASDSFDDKEMMDSYKSMIRPRLKFRTSDEINNIARDISKESGKKPVVLCGHFVGLALAAKNFNSTLDQHHFYGRHLLGLKKRSYYTERAINKISKNSTNSGRNMEAFMCSMFLPTASFDRLVPFANLKVAPGLTEEETSYLAKRVFKNYLKSFADTVNWDCCEIPSNPGKLFRSFKRDFYAPSFSWEAADSNRHFPIEIVYLFSSLESGLFCDNYKLPAIDLICNKKVVYDYFFDKTGVSIKNIGKAAIRRLTLKERISSQIFFLNDQIPQCMKGTWMFKALKKKFFKTLIGRNDVGALDYANLIMRGDAINFSEYVSESVLKGYFGRIEKELYGSPDYNYMSYTAERYLNLSVYIKDKLKNN